MEEKTELEDQINRLRATLNQATVPGDELASGSDIVIVRFKMKDDTNGAIELSWDSILLAIAPHLMTESEEFIVEHHLNMFLSREIAERKTANNSDQKTGANIYSEDLFKVIYQFIALEYIEPITLTEQTNLMGTLGTRRTQGYKLTRHGVRTLASMQATRKFDAAAKE